MGRLPRVSSTFEADQAKSVGLHHTSSLNSCRNGLRSSSSAVEQTNSFELVYKTNDYSPSGENPVAIQHPELKTPFDTHDNTHVQMIIFYSLSTVIAKELITYGWVTVVESDTMKQYNAFVIGAEELDDDHCIGRSIFISI